MAKCIVVSVIKSARFAIINSMCHFQTGGKAEQVLEFVYFEKYLLGKFFYFHKTSIALSLFTAFTSILLVVE